MTTEEIAKVLRDLAFLQIHEDAANLIDSQAAQITALQEIAIQERAWWYWATIDKECIGGMHPELQEMRTNFENNPHGRKLGSHYLDEAREQLEAEHPEAMNDRHR